MNHAADAVEAGAWTPLEMNSADLPRRFGFVRSPIAARPSAEG